MKYLRAFNNDHLLFSYNETIELIKELLKDCPERAMQLMVQTKLDISGDPFKHAEIILNTVKETLVTHPNYVNCKLPNKNDLKLFSIYDIGSLIITGTVYIGLNIESDTDISIDVPLMVMRKFLTKYVNFNQDADSIGYIAYNRKENNHLN